MFTAQTCSWRAQPARPARQGRWRSRRSQHVANADVAGDPVVRRQRGHAVELVAGFEIARKRDVGRYPVDPKRPNSRGSIAELRAGLVDDVADAGDERLRVSGREATEHDDATGLRRVLDQFRQRFFGHRKAGERDEQWSTLGVGHARLGASDHFVEVEGAITGSDIGHVEPFDRGVTTLDDLLRLFPVLLAIGGHVVEECLGIILELPSACFDCLGIETVRALGEDCGYAADEAESGERHGNSAVHGGPPSYSTQQLRLRQRRKPTSSPLTG